MALTNEQKHAASEKILAGVTVLVGTVVQVVMKDEDVDKIDTYIDTIVENLESSLNTGMDITGSYVLKEGLGQILDGVADLVPDKPALRSILKSVDDIAGLVGLDDKLDELLDGLNADE